MRKFIKEAALSLGVLGAMGAADKAEAKPREAVKHPEVAQQAEGVDTSREVVDALEGESSKRQHERIAIESDVKTLEGPIFMAAWEEATKELGREPKLQVQVDLMASPSHRGFIIDNFIAQFAGAEMGRTLKQLLEMSSNIGNPREGKITPDIGYSLMKLHAEMEKTALLEILVKSPDAKKHAATLQAMMKAEIIHADMQAPEEERNPQY